MFERMLERDGGHEKVRRAFNKKVISIALVLLILSLFTARVGTKAANEE